MSRMLQWIKMQHIYIISLLEIIIYLPYQTIFQRHGIQTQHPAVTLNIHILILIN